MQAALPNKALMGEAAYYAAAFANPRPDVVGFRITVDGQTYEREGIMCLVANAAMIQGTCRSCRTAAWTTARSTS